MKPTKTTMARLTMALAISVVAGGYLASRVGAHAAQNPQVIKITASKYHFTPDHIILKKDQPVTLQFTSTDATHGFMIRALHIDTDIKPGAVIEKTVTPQTAGTFKAICDHYCGLGHGGMNMTVVVE